MVKCTTILLCVFSFLFLSVGEPSDKIPLHRFLADIENHRDDMIEVARLLFEKPTFSDSYFAKESLSVVLNHVDLFIDQYLPLHDLPKVMTLRELKNLDKESTLGPYPFSEPFYLRLHRWHGLDFRRDLSFEEQLSALKTVELLNLMEAGIKQREFWNKWGAFIGEGGRDQFSMLEEWIDIALVRTDPTRRFELGLDPLMDTDIEGVVEEVRIFFRRRISQELKRSQDIQSSHLEPAEALKELRATRQAIMSDRMALRNMPMIVPLALDVLQRRQKSCTQALRLPAKNNEVLKKKYR